MKSRAGAAFIGALAVSLLVSASVAGAATVTIKNMDAAGQGFNDTTPATPVGGNAGTTVGEQSMNVFKKAAQMWGDALESVPTIVIDASFGPLTCSATQIMLGHAGYTSTRENSPGAPPNTWTPIPLANALAGTDLNGADSEISAEFNGALSACSMGEQNWYYGLDGNAGDDIDLLAVVLHEFGHGLGFASVVDPANGTAPHGMLDSFAQHVYDNGTNKSWKDMTDAERQTSALNVRHLVWDGPNVARQMPQILTSGSPTMTATPTLSGFGGHVTEAEFGPYLSVNSVSGPLKMGKLSNTTCAVTSSVSGGIVLFTQSQICPPVQMAFMAQQAGAVGVLIEDPEMADPPYAVSVLPSIHDFGPVTIPTLAVSVHDGTLLGAAPSGTTILLGATADQRVGADTMGRTDLFASTPILGASTLSHWDPLARSDLLMEPEIASKATHDQRMELAVFRDIGWHTVCGNGKMDSGEACDAGDQNGVSGSACNADCTAGAPSGSGGASGTGVANGSGGGGPTGTGGESSGSGGDDGGGGGRSGSGGAGGTKIDDGGKGGACDLSGSGSPASVLQLLALAGLTIVVRRRPRPPQLAVGGSMRNHRRR